MTSHSKDYRPRSVNYLSSALSEYFDRHQDFDYRFPGSFESAARRFLSAVEIVGLSRNVRLFWHFRRLDPFFLPCGIGGDLADLGLEFGVDRGDCVWWFFSSFISPSSCCISCRRESCSAPRCPSSSPFRCLSCLSSDTSCGLSPLAASCSCCRSFWISRIISLFFDSSCEINSRCVFCVVDSVMPETPACSFPSFASRAAYRAIIVCGSSLELKVLCIVCSPIVFIIVLSSDRPVARESKVDVRSYIPSLNPLWWEGKGDGGTMCERFKVFSGWSGNFGRTVVVCFSGTHRKLFRSEWPICLLGLLKHEYSFTSWSFWWLSVVRPCQKQSWHSWYQIKCFKCKKESRNSCFEAIFITTW